jgi:hypothetical protein
MRCVDRLRFVCCGAALRNSELLRYVGLTLGGIALFLILLLGTGPLVARVVTPRFDADSNCTARGPCDCGPPHWKWVNATPHSWSQYGGCVFFGLLAQLVVLFFIIVTALLAWGVAHGFNALCAEWRQPAETHLVQWPDDEEEHHSR